MPVNNPENSITAEQRELTAELKNLPHFIISAANMARKLHFTAKQIQEIELVLEEALVNIIKYAYPPDRPGSLTLKLKGEHDGRLTLQIRDRGIPFNPLLRTDPDLEAGLMERPVGGLGIVLMKTLTDEISWHREHEENCLTIIFTPHHD